MIPERPNKANHFRYFVATCVHTIFKLQSVSLGTLYFYNYLHVFQGRVVLNNSSGMCQLVNILIVFPPCCAMNEILTCSQSLVEGQAAGSWQIQLGFPCLSTWQTLPILQWKFLHGSGDRRKKEGQSQVFLSGSMTVKAKYSPAFTKKSSAFCKFVKMQLDLALNKDKLQMRIFVGLLVVPGLSWMVKYILQKKVFLI